MKHLNLFVSTCPKTKKKVTYVDILNTDTYISMGFTLLFSIILFFGPGSIQQIQKTINKELEKFQQTKKDVLFMQKYKKNDNKNTHKKQQKSFWKKC